MSSISLKDLKDQLSDSQIKEILQQFNIEPAFENELYIVFPTCCHNLEGGSNKLYYYKNTKLFRCYTECNDIFNIFTLLIKIYKLRGKDINIQQAITLCNLDNSQDIDYSNNSSMQDYKYMQELNNRFLPKKQNEFEIYDEKILNRYPFNYEGVRSWIEEGIGLEEIYRFNIRYDPIQNCIVIPNYDINGNLIGVRGRFLDEDSPAKYAPLWYGGTCLSHHTGKTFYGIKENKEIIKRKHMVVITEGEKSVLKFGTYYPGNNVALATLGQGLGRNHIDLLLQLQVKDVVLAYDADYETYDELKEKAEQYKKIASILTPYFNVSILLDYDLELGYKDSPLDKGKAVFERLLRERVILK